MAQRLLTPPSSRLLQDADADVEQASTRVADNADIPDLISTNGDQDIAITLGTSEDNDNGENYLADSSDEHSNEERGHVDQQLLGSCIYCSKHKRMQTFDQIKRSDCIRFPRRRGLY